MEPLAFVAGIHLASILIAGLDLHDYTDISIKKKIVLLTVGIFGLGLYELAKKSEYYKRNGYFIPTKANRSKKLLRTLSE